MKTRLFPERFADEDTLNVVGGACQANFKGNINLLVWNIYKGRNKSWQDDFLHLTHDRNLVMLQESVLNTRHDSLFQAPDRFEWVMAKAYTVRHSQAATGVKTGAFVASAGRSYYTSQDLEPLLRTPKMLLATTYPLESRDESLLCVNVHAINFVSMQKYSRQLSQIAQAIENHSGPVILAGDFNTWNAVRHRNLREVTQKMGLIELPLERKGRWHHFNQDLDHVFYRGLIPQKSSVLFNIRTSDHYPINVDFILA